ncbi:MAG: putative C-S lyase, partial [Chloroflexi bacterium]|nr:putative C-S lyase [Chloroflexota bacterium]
REKFDASRRGLADWVNVFGQTAMQTAYQEGGPWLNALLEYIESNRDYLYDIVTNEMPGIRMAKPEGTFLAWLDCRDANIAGNPSDFFLESARVAVNDGRWFGSGGEGFVRLNFGCPRSLLKEALQRMKSALTLLQ